MAGQTGLVPTALGGHCRVDSNTGVKDYLLPSSIKSIGSTTSTRRLCDLSSMGKKEHNLRVEVVDPASTTDITSKSR